MLLAFLIYNDGIGTIIRMATIYGTEIGIDTGAMIASIVLVQFVGIPFSFALRRCWRAGSAPSGRSCSALVVYTGISVLGYFMTPRPTSSCWPSWSGWSRGGARR